MNKVDPQSTAPRNDSNQSRWVWFIVAGCVLLVLIALFSRRQRDKPGTDRASTTTPGRVTPADSAALKAWRERTRRSPSTAAPAPTVEEIVAGKVIQFIKSRRKLAHAMAEHFKTPVPDEMERFFDAAEVGRYDEMEAIYKSLRKQRENGTGIPDYGPQWRTVIETEGAAREAHDWPAQKLLDYGNAVLDSLRPGMIYVGGTDPGCFIPTLLNETSEGERRVTLTQNALADDTYLDYLNFLYGDRMATLTKDDSQRVYQDYVADARKRLDHDQQFPDEPKQIRPGEDVRLNQDGGVHVSGQVSVMAINEKLFQMFMGKNPDASFAMEESFPFKSTFGSATPLGPIMELRVQDEQNALTRERASQSVDYWRTTAQQLLSDPQAADSREVRMSYSKLVSSQAGLLLDRGYTAEAEQAFRLANEIAPTSPEAVFRYINLLVEQKRFEDAMPVAENAVRIEPENNQFRDLVKELKRLNKK